MKLALAALAVPMVLAGCAAGPQAPDRDSRPLPRCPAASAAPTPGQMDQMMASMQQMHERMLAANTPEERARLMQENQALMHDGMDMMGRMRGGCGGMGGPMGGMPLGPDMMGRRMDMMEMMMQMMMDREGMAPAAR